MPSKSISSIRVLVLKGDFLFNRPSLVRCMFPIASLVIPPDCLTMPTVNYCLLSYIYYDRWLHSALLVESLQGIHHLTIMLA